MDKYIISIKGEPFTSKLLFELLNFAGSFF